MLDLCFERLLESEEWFSERNGHRFVEIWNCGNNRKPIYQSGELKEKEIAGWVNEDRSANGPFQSTTSLRVLLCPKPGGKPSSGKLPFSRATYRALSHAWRIPSTFLRAVTQKLSIVTECAVASTVSPPDISSTDSLSYQSKDVERRSKLGDESICLLVRGDVDWTWDYTLHLIFDPMTHTTCALIVGLTATEIDLVHSYLCFPTVTCPAMLLTHPMLLPVILLDLATDDTSSLLKARAKLLSQIQQQTGMDRFNSLKSVAVGGQTSTGKEKDRQELDLDAVMLRLTCLSDWVAAQRGFIALQGRAVDAVGKIIIDVHPRCANEAEDLQHRTTTVFQDCLSFIKETLLAAEQKGQYFERSINAQVQTIYSLIGQKDNRLNILAANSSCQLASDSRHIAILTRRDSTDMRIIASVTLMFLPGTFVATVFSTGMFNWEIDGPTPSGTDSGGGQMVSSYIWVYFMLTGVLTFLVLVDWVLFSWVQNKKMMSQFGLDPELGRVAEERRDTEMTLVVGKNLGRRAKALKKFEKWTEEAKGSPRWWGLGRKNECHDTEEELKSA